jgi:DNA-binding PadR family transcriptional regulator
MSNTLPPITHLQFLVLEALTGGEQAGRDVRALLAAHAVKSSAPAFYQMMGRLEDADLVEGWYDQKLVGGQHVKERRYRVTRRGERALADTRAFYVPRLAPGRALKRPSNA